MYLHDISIDVLSVVTSTVCVDRKIFVINTGQGSPIIDMALMYYTYVMLCISTSTTMLVCHNSNLPQKFVLAAK